MERLTYTVPEMSCAHCKSAVEGEVGQIAGVVRVDANLDSKLVVVEGEELDDAAIRAAIDEAGYDVA